MTSTTADVPGKPRSETWTLSLIAAVHMVSHFYWLLFVPLLPMLKDLLQVSYVQLGFALTVANVVSALTQAPTGFLVDRFGPRLLLLIGVALGASGFILLGLFPTYPVMLVAAALVGLGNAVYHPADFSILSREMSAARMGRAYSLHAFTGYLGFAAAPPVVLALAYFGGVSFALITCALIGVVVALPLIPEVPGERRSVGNARKTSAPSTPARALLSPSILALTLMFTLLSLSTNIMQTYMVAALEGMVGAPQSVGNVALTTFLLVTVGGILVGGLLADRARAQSHVAAGGFALAAVCVLALAIFKPSGLGAIVLIGAIGFLSGIIVPSRDLLVKAAAPADAVGRVFGIVTTGFNFGGIIGPPIGGALLDHQLPEWIFFISAIFMSITVVVALAVDKQAARKAAAA
jgi:FSR family fosmidomycin resistance protein-like MFS transporter